MLRFGDAAIPVQAITPRAVKDALVGDREFALIDVREFGQYGEGHPFFSVNLPYSQLECLAPRLLPSRYAMVVVFDDGDGVAARAAGRLTTLGYEDVRVMVGGAPAWSQAGFTLFKGVNLPSKAFAELVEQALETPHLSADALRAQLASGANVVVLDGRTPAEYRKMSIPGARSCPNAELSLRIHALTPDPDATIVINCAGRTRSIIGAENLRALGLPNPIIALENGTQGWQLAGLELERGKTPQPLPGVSEHGARIAKQWSRVFAQRYAIPRVSSSEIEQWREGSLSLYVFDVRSAEEFHAGHLRGSTHAPGGQLAQATDHWVAVRGARIVLVDNYELRAFVTARWLRAMGHDAYVAETLPDDLSDIGDPLANQETFVSTLANVDPAKLNRLTVLDCSSSAAYRLAHIDGARWACRPRLAALGLDSLASIVLTAEDRQVAELAAIDLRELGFTVHGFVEHSLEAWTRAGLRVVSMSDGSDGSDGSDRSDRSDGSDGPVDEECIDYLFFVHDRHEGNLAAAREYLAWETGLIAQLDAQERAMLRPR